MAAGQLCDHLRLAALRVALVAAPLPTGVPERTLLQTALDTLSFKCQNYPGPCFYLVAGEFASVQTGEFNFTGLLAGEGSK